MNLASIIKYFKECYKADQREQTIWNIFDNNKTEHLWLLDKEEELLTGNLPHQYIDPEKANAILKTLTIYEKEKRLFYYSCFVTGHTNLNLAGKKQICAPLFYYPAEIFEEKDNFFVRINSDELHINIPLINLLDNNEDESYAEFILQHLPQFPLSFDELIFFIKKIEPLFPDVNFEKIRLYPDLMNEEEIKSFGKKKNLTILPASALGIVTMSTETRGVLNELETLISEKSYAAPVQKLFLKEQANTTKTAVSSRVPAVLSNSQKDILKVAQTSPLSLLVGPPGTGKSYTIAALAIDFLSRGQSVLIASKMNHAVDVVASKIENLIGESSILVRGGRKEYMSNMVSYLEDILMGIGLSQHDFPEEIKKLTKEIKALEEKLQKLHKHYEERVAQELKWSDYILKNENKKFFINRWLFKAKESKIEATHKKQDALWDIVIDIEECINKRNKLLVQFIRANDAHVTKTTRDNHRKELKDFVNAVKSRTSKKQNELFSQIDFSVLLKAFPIWLVNLSDISNILPLKKEMFDLVIIDEATQCDISSCLPVLQRAKHAVIVGDPHQLRHISFLSRSRQERLLAQTGLPYQTLLDYREKSILDIINDTIQNAQNVAFLDEHYRSLPAIIEFSNQHFYRDALKIMTQTPKNEKDKSVVLVKCDGERNMQGINEAEAEAIIVQIQELVRAEKKLNSEVCHSIGILSPFRSQVDYIAKKVQETFKLDVLQKHDIMIGTSHSFQGEERDIMMISFVVDSKSPGGSFVHLNKADVFNVAITRARLKQIILTSVDETKLNKDNLLTKYLLAIQKEMEDIPVKYSHQEGYLFVQEVINSMKRMGYKCYAPYQIAGMAVDILVESDEHILGLDLIGYSAEFRNTFPLERYQMLNRAGLMMLPVPYTMWRYNRKACIEIIKQYIKDGY